MKTCVIIEENSL